MDNENLNNNENNTSVDVQNVDKNVNSDVNVNKKNNNNIPVIICLIIVVLSLIGIIVCLVFFNNKNTNIVNDLTNNTENKEQNQIVNTDNDNTNTNINTNADNNTNSNTNISIPKLTEEEAKAKIKRYFTGISGPEIALQVFYGKNIIVNTGDYYKLNGLTYAKTDIDWNDFKNEVNKFISNELYERKNLFIKADNAPWTIEKDGKLNVLTIGLSGSGYYIDKLILKEQAEGIYIYDVIGRIGRLDLNDYQDARVIFKYVNGNYILTEAKMNDSYYVIAKKLFDTYLLSKKNYSLTEYTIDNVEIIIPKDGDQISSNYTDLDNKIFAQITYSVRPIEAHKTDWTAGNGEEVDGWIKNKISCIVIDKISNIIEKNGTSF